MPYSCKGRLLNLVGLTNLFEMLYPRLKNLKNVWKGIKKIISLNNSNLSSPTAITVNNKTITNPSDFANPFNNYFAKVAMDIHSSIKFSMKKYFDYLPPLNI